jgi:peptidoglycan/LPS O-acetylase OafA/YrhL
MRMRRPQRSTWVFAALAVFTSAVIFTAAALVPAPPAVLPLVLAVCIGGPMLAAWELRSKLHRTAGPLDSTALARLRRHLDELPETQHPLGL